MKKDLRNPLARARGLGSAKEGVSHWAVHRVTGVAMVFLGLYFVGLVLSVLHADYATARATLMRPYNAVLLIAMLLTMFRHLTLGLQIVVEDYVHTKWLEWTSLIVIKFIAVLAALTGVLAVLRVMLGS
jgi:succinate dehydrogenase / fumarate reductase, membrane anchor subunit